MQHPALPSLARVVAPKNPRIRRVLQKSPVAMLARHLLQALLQALREAPLVAPGEQARASAPFAPRGLAPPRQPLRERQKPQLVGWKTPLQPASEFFFQPIRQRRQHRLQA